MSEHATATHAAPSGHAAHDSGHGTSLGVDSRKMGVWAFIGSETLFFAALIVTYLIYKPRNLANGGQDPKEFLGIGVTSVLAAILLASSLTMVLALAAIRRHDMRRFRIWLLSTAGLGLCFLGGQVYEFTKLVSEGVTLSSSLFGTLLELSAECGVRACQRTRDTDQNVGPGGTAKRNHSCQGHG